MFTKAYKNVQRKRFYRLSEQQIRLQELVDGLDEEFWPDEYAAAREELAAVSIKRANLGARLRVEV